MLTNTTETSLSLTKARHIGGRVAQEFRRASAGALRPGRAAERAQKNQLQQLTAERCADLYNALRRGWLADVMIAWDELEEYDDILSAVADKRAAGLAECEASILPDSAMIGENEELRVLADKQQAFLVHYLSRIVNMEEAIAHLGSAAFRGFAHLYKHTRENGSLQLVVFPQWYFARPAGTDYLLNPTAASSTGELYELNPASWIVREVKRPIDLVAMFACVAKYNAEQGNASFLEVFGNPSIFFEYPPGTSDERAREYDAVVREMIGDGRGGFPAGGKITTVESKAAGGQSFIDAATWANKKIVRKALGGELTLLSESGSGTLAGGAHEDGLISLYKADAKSIAAVLHEQLFKPAIQDAFPGAPVLVRYKLDYPQQYDIAVETAAIATLVNAGFKPSTEQVKERTGYDCTEVATAASQGMNMGTPPAWQGGGMSMNRAAMLNREDAAGEEDGSEPPLTDDEWAQFEAAGQVDAGHLERMRAAIEAKLKAAAEPYREQNAQNAPQTPASPAVGTFTKNRQNTPAEPMRSAKNGQNTPRRGFFGRVMGYIRHIFTNKGPHKCTATKRACPLTAVGELAESCKRGYVRPARHESAKARKEYQAEITKAAADGKLSVTSQATGQPLAFTGKTVEHLKLQEEGEFNKRMDNVGNFLATAHDPDYVMEHKNGKELERVYLREMNDGSGKKRNNTNSHYYCVVEHATSMPGQMYTAYEVDNSGRYGLKIKPREMVYRKKRK
jgi:phage gp29-like protein